MSIDDFILFLKNEGLEDEEDCSKLKSNKLAIMALITLLIKQKLMLFRCMLVLLYLLNNICTLTQYYIYSSGVSRDLNGGGGGGGVEGGGGA